MFAKLRQRLRQWWHSRSPRTDVRTLTQRSTYILPTRAGWMLAATLLVLLIASINYQLNLGYLLTFMLAGAAAVGMHLTHGNLRGLTLNLIGYRADHSATLSNALGGVFAGSVAMIEVRLSQERTGLRPSIGLALLDPQHKPQWAWADVPAQGSCTLAVAFKTSQRGAQPIPPVIAETRYPMGTFRVWTIWRPKSPVLVYPKPEAHPPPLPPGQPRAGGASTSSAQPSGEFSGLRPYRRGDMLKHIAWKKVAKSDSLVSRDTEHSQRHELMLDYSTCAAPGHEARLSRLTAWVLAAEKLALDYGLQLPQLNIAPSRGSAHQRACLEALALC